MPVSKFQFDIENTIAIWEVGLLTKGEARLILGIDNGDENEPLEEGK